MSDEVKTPVESAEIEEDRFRRALRAALSVPRQPLKSVTPKRDGGQTDSASDQGEAKVAKDEKTSKVMAGVAGKALRDPKAGNREKRLAGTALTQAPNRKKPARKKK